MGQPSRIDRIGGEEYGREGLQKTANPVARPGGRMKDGFIFPIELTPRYIPYHGHQIRVTSVIDLTERKKPDEEFIESEGRYK
jgi:hypothetical protein